MRRCEPAHGVVFPDAATGTYVSLGSAKACRQPATVRIRLLVDRDWDSSYDVCEEHAVLTALWADDLDGGTDVVREPIK